MKRAYVFPFLIIPTFSISECVHGIPDDEALKSIIITMEEKAHPDVSKELRLSNWHCKLMAHKQSHSCDVIYRTTSAKDEKATKAELIVKRVNDKWILIKRF